MPIVQTEHLYKIYRQGAHDVQALNDVNITVGKGEFVALLGASGSGKSTLLHLLGAVDLPTAGKVYIDGEDIYEKREEELAVFRRRKLGFVFQFYNLIPVLNAEENILLPLQLDGQLPDREYLEDLLCHFNLQDRRNFLPNQLSGGQQQRVAVARALIHKPSLILADEPTGNLDTRNSREIISLMTSCVRRYGQTMVLITHDPSIAAQADRVIMIEDGRIMEG